MNIGEERWALQASLNDAPLARTNDAQSATPVRVAQLWSCPGTPVALHTAPAQSPLRFARQPMHTRNGGSADANVTHQRVVSKMALWSVKYVDGLHVDAGNVAIGVPQPDGSGAPLSMSLGTEPRAKNHVVIPSSSQSAAMHPSSEVAICRGRRGGGRRGCGR